MAGYPKYNATPPTVLPGQEIAFQTDVNGNLKTTATYGDTTGAFVVAKPTISGGLSIFRLVNSAGANIKASAGQIYSGVFTNTNIVTRYLHLYNKATAAVLSTDTPVATIPLAPSVAVAITLANIGAEFTLGIAFAFTTDNIAVPVTAGLATDIHGTLFYK